MNLFDVIGPVMVGPSSSHTAGAVRMGNIARRLLGEPVGQARLLLYGSFLASGRGHGTHQALVAGLLGMEPDDPRIPRSFELAKEQGLSFSFGKADLREAHPNTAKLLLWGRGGRELEVVAASLGGGRIRVCSIDGLEANFCGDSPTLVVHNLDQPGHVTQITSALSSRGINIATIQLYRDHRGGRAVFVMECDQEVPQASLDWIAGLEGIQKVTYLPLKKPEEERP